MLKNVTLRTKLLGIGALMTVVPLMAISAVVLCQNQRMVRIAEQGSTDLVYADLNHITRNIYDMCKAQQVNIDAKLNIALGLLRSAGPVHLASETIAWDSVSQQSN
ncbi:MAG: hypothetical protein ABFE01_22995, partial [Phycisphaerales bacterium]